MEIWKDVPGYEGLYQASNLGNIRALEHHDKAGKLRKPKPIRPALNADGYYQFVATKQGTRKTTGVARAVWSAFNGIVPDNMQVNHINEDKTDNRLENLNLMTHKENTNWGTRTERASETNSIVLKNRQDCSKPVNQYTLEGELVATYPSQQEAARQNPQLFRSAISACCRGTAKSHGGYLWSYAS